MFTFIIIITYLSIGTLSSSAPVCAKWLPAALKTALIRARRMNHVVNMLIKRKTMSYKRLKSLKFLSSPTHSFDSVYGNCCYKALHSGPALNAIMWLKVYRK